MKGRMLKGGNTYNIMRKEQHDTVQVTLKTHTGIEHSHSSSARFPSCHSFSSLAFAARAVGGSVLVDEDRPPLGDLQRWTKQLYLFTSRGPIIPHPGRRHLSKSVVAERFPPPPCVCE